MLLSLSHSDSAFPGTPSLAPETERGRREGEIAHPRLLTLGASLAAYAAADLSLRSLSFLWHLCASLAGDDAFERNHRLFRLIIEMKLHGIWVIRFWQEFIYTYNPFPWIDSRTSHTHTDWQFGSRAPAAPVFPT